VPLWSTVKRLQVEGYASILLFPVNGYKKSLIPQSNNKISEQKIMRINQIYSLYNQ
jgi:hypothetical protein